MYKCILNANHMVVMAQRLTGSSFENLCVCFVYHNDMIYAKPDKQFLVGTNSCLSSAILNGKVPKK